MDINQIVNMTARAWCLPILDAMASGVPARQAPLLKATGAGRTSFVQSLDHLIQIGLVERNPGYGHPLRPEFRLTDKGQTAAALSKKIGLIKTGESKALLRRSWTIPILAKLQRPMHFGGIKKDLGAITDRALSQSLKSMETHKWVQRDLSIDLRPPRPLYRPIGTGKAITDVIASVDANM